MLKLLLIIFGILFAIGLIWYLICGAFYILVALLKNLKYVLPLLICFLGGCLYNAQIIPFFGAFFIIGIGAYLFSFVSSDSSKLEYELKGADESMIKELFSGVVAPYIMRIGACTLGEYFSNNDSIYNLIKKSKVDIISAISTGEIVLKNTKNIEFIEISKELASGNKINVNSNYLFKSKFGGPNIESVELEWDEITYFNALPAPSNTSQSSDTYNNTNTLQINYKHTSEEINSIGKIESKKEENIKQIYFNHKKQILLIGTYILLAALGITIFITYTEGNLCSGFFNHFL